MEDHKSGASFCISCSGFFILLIICINSSVYAFGNTYRKSCTITICKRNDRIDTIDQMYQCTESYDKNVAYLYRAWFVAFTFILILNLIYHFYTLHRMVYRKVKITMKCWKYQIMGLHFFNELALGALWYFVTRMQMEGIFYKRMSCENKVSAQAGGKIKE